MTFARTLLVPLDGSIQATVAIPVARGFGELLHASVALLHVSDDALTPAALVERMNLANDDVPGLIIEHRQGAAAAAIVEAAREHHAAVIVMCPQIRTDLRSRALGSVAAAVLRAAPCPVVLVPPARGRKRWALHQLLVPHDGTPTSAATIGPATELALKAEAELVVLHVATPGAETPPEPGTLVFPRYVDQPQHEWPAWAQEFLARLCAVGGARNGTEMRLTVAQGEASAAIIDFARQSDLIVLGWRGALEPGRARTMQRVICDTACPMIVLRVDRDSDRRYWPWSS
jgi:nucleotide-binding universal stress UspA family protein